MAALELQCSLSVTLFREKKTVTGRQLIMNCGVRHIKTKNLYLGWMITRLEVLFQLFEKLQRHPFNVLDVWHKKISQISGVVDSSINI